MAWATVRRGIRHAAERVLGTFVDEERVDEFVRMIRESLRHREVIRELKAARERLEKERIKQLEAIGGLKREKENLTETIEALKKEKKKQIDTIHTLEKEKDKQSETIYVLEKEKEDIKKEQQKQLETIDALNREKEKISETLYRVKEAYEGQTDQFVAKETVHPGIVFNTLPKSGSVYISKTLAASLDIEHRELKIAHGFFPHYYIMPNAVQRIAQGNAVRQEHFEASPVNVKYLSRVTDRLVVNVRDPRQANLSWLHHVNRILAERPDEPNYTVHDVPDGYTDWPLEKQLDWHIDTQLRSSVEWIEGWVAVAEGGGPLQVLFTRFEDMVADETAFLERIVDFYDIPRAAFAHAPAEKSIANNFRKGKTDEWLGVYTDKQKKRCEKMIGPDLLKRFGWD